MVLCLKLAKWVYWPNLTPIKGLGRQFSLKIVICTTKWILQGTGHRKKFLQTVLWALKTALQSSFPLLDYSSRLEFARWLLPFGIQVWFDNRKGTRTIYKIVKTSQRNWLPWLGGGYLYEFLSRLGSCFKCFVYKLQDRWNILIGWSAVLWC